MQIIRVSVIVPNYNGIEYLTPCLQALEAQTRAADEIIKKKQAPKKVQFPRGYSLIVKQGRALFCPPGRVAFPGRVEK